MALRKDSEQKKKDERGNKERIAPELHPCPKGRAECDKYSRVVRSWKKREIRTCVTKTAGDIQWWVFTKGTSLRRRVSQLFGTRGIRIDFFCFDESGSEYRESLTAKKEGSRGVRRVKEGTRPLRGVSHQMTRRPGSVKWFKQWG